MAVLGAWLGLLSFFPWESSWAASPDQELRALSGNRVAIVNPVDQEPADGALAADIDLMVNPEDPPQPATPSPADASDAAAQLAASDNALAIAATTLEDGLVAIISAPWATDAAGHSVPMSLTTNGDEIVMHVDHKQDNTTYPVVADPVISVAPPRAASVARAGTARIRTLTWNVKYGELWPGSGGEKLDYATEVIRTAIGSTRPVHSRTPMPGLAGLQEMCRSDMVGIMARLRTDDQPWDWVFHKTRDHEDCGQDERRGNVVVSNRRIKFSRAHAYKHQEDERERRNYVFGWARLHSRDIYFFNTHLAAQREDRLTNTKGRQASQLLSAALAVRQGGNHVQPVMIFGDFNADRDSRVIAKYRDSPLVELTTGTRWPTVRRPTGSFVDHIFASRFRRDGPVHHEVWRGDTRFAHSDHTPVFLTAQHR